MALWKEVSAADTNELKLVAQQLHVHPLALEDCIHRDQRPKLEDYGNHQLLIWFLMIDGRIYELQFLIFPDQLLMIPHEAPPSGANWQEYLKIVGDQYTGKDVWHLLYAALDKATDITWTELRRLYADVDRFEEQMFKHDFDPQSLLKLKNRLNKVDYTLGHLPSVTKQLQNFSQPKDDLNWKLRDLHDHCERIYQSIALYRSQIVSTIELYWGLQANRTNRQIKKLSLLASVAVPMTFWASFWGMNFEMIPFSSQGLFYAALLVMALSVAVTIWFSVRRGYWRD